MRRCANKGTNDQVARGRHKVTGFVFNFKEIEGPLGELPAQRAEAKHGRGTD